jgi:hypothetical protein
MNVRPAVGPFIGFGVGYVLGRLGIGPVPASLIGMGVSIGWTVVGPRTLFSSSVVAAKALWVTPVGPMAAAVAVPVAIGAGASYVIAGKEGIEDYKEFLTEPLRMPGRVVESLVLLQEHTNTNRAVAGNAAGLPTGTQVGSTYTASGSQDWFGDMSGNQLYW